MANNYMETWKKGSIKIGTPTNLIAAFTAFIPVIYLCATYDCWPDLSLVLSAWGLTAISYGAFYVVEPVSYYASLGLAGTYLGFLSGNIGNMRVPCAALALDVTKSETGSMQAEVVSTMAICGSIITNLIATTSAAFVGAGVVAALPAFVNRGLQTYASSAIFGAAFGGFALKDPKMGVFGLGIPLICKFFFTWLPAWVVIIISVFGTVAVSRVFYVLQHKGAK